MTISAEEIIAWINRRIDQDVPVINFSPSMARDIAASLTEMKAEIERLSAELDAETAAVEGEIHVRELAYELVRDCAAALENGAFVSPECSHEFHAQVPTEITKCVSALRSRIAALEAQLAEREGVMDMKGRRHD